MKACSVLYDVVLMIVDLRMKNRPLRPVAVLVVGFLAIILFGSALLSLPFSQKSSADLTYLDCLFVSTSAVCVTGLSTVDLASSFTASGNFIIALLIQIGGLGFATMAVFTLSVLGMQLRISDISLAKESLNRGSSKNIMSLVRDVMAYSFAIELAGSALLYPVFKGRGMSVFKSIMMSAFHSVSAFNNAGFDLNGDSSSLASLNGNAYAYFVFSLLILLGGLGFLVMRELLEFRRKRPLSLHAKIVLASTAVLLVFGTLLIASGGVGLLDSFFLSVSSRTAGFATFPLDKLSDSSALVVVVLMFIGANPGSTGGGIKTTTAFVIFAAMVSVVTGKQPKAFKRAIKQESVMKALTVFIMAVLIACFATFAILLVESGKFSFMDILFEVISAVATVGLSRSVTSGLEVVSKLILIAVMFAGRVGALTIVSALVRRKSERLKFVEEDIMIG